MTVYLVSRGDYSDYEVVGIFSTQEKALSYIGEFTEEFNGVKEFELDNTLEKAPIANHLAGVIDLKTGEVKISRRHEESWQPMFEKMYIENNYYRSDECPQLLMDFDHLDEDLATKVLGEKRAHINCMYGKNPPHGYISRQTLQPLKY